MRGYDDPCAVARTLGLVGERWALLVVRELIFGPKRFSDLRRGLAGISENVLSQRLRELERAELVRRRRFAPSSTSAYELTERGRGLEPVLVAMSRWGADLPLPEGTDPALGVDALVFTLRATFDAGLAERLDVVAHLRFGDDHHFRVEVRNGRFRARCTEPDDADVTITTTAPALQSLVSADHTLAKAERAGEITITGERAAAEHLLRCFPPPH
jgi:DNA-binding HxlR family transcriptional regulator